MQQVSDRGALRLRPEREAAVGATARPIYTAAKRVFDVGCALMLLILTAPVWLLAVMLIRLTSPGPVLSRQVRVGQDRRLFTCYKFRTMTIDADELLVKDRRLFDQFRGSWKLDQDPRITPVGRWLRRSSIDELPQILNLLRGEMSMVGPRPVQPRELQEQFGPLADVVTSVKPGLTSLWSVSGRSLLSYDERVVLEVEYVRRRSFRLDVLIALLTLPAVITGRGAM